MEVVPPYYIQPSYPVHSTLGTYLIFFFYTITYDNLKIFFIIEILYFIFLHYIKDRCFIVYTGILKLEDIESETSAFMALHQRLEEELRAAKRAQLSCGEVLLPPDLLRRIARDVLKMAESEPCGLR